jgi:hypothetical protein
MNNRFMIRKRSSPRLLNIRREEWLQHFNNVSERRDMNIVRSIRQLLIRYETENTYRKKKIVCAIYELFVEYPFIMAEFPKVREVSIRKIHEYIEKHLIGRSKIDKKITDVFRKFNEMIMFIHLHSSYIEHYHQGYFANIVIM